MEKTRSDKNSSLRRIKYLMLMQLGDEKRSRANNSKGRRLFFAFLKVCLTIAVTVAITVVFSYLNNYFHVKLSKDLFISILLITQLLSIFSCASSILTVMYINKDNKLLMAFPCTYDEVFISKLIVFAKDELKRSLFFTVPFLVAYGILAGGVYYWVFALFAWLMLVLIPVAIGAMLSIPIIYIKRFLDKHLIVNALLILLLLAAAFVGVTIILRGLPDPLRLVAVYGQFISGVESFLNSVAQFAVWYVFIGNAMFGQMPLLFFPLFVAIFVSIVCLMYFFARPFYFKTVSETAEAGRTKKHLHINHKVNNLFLTFFRKEVKLFFRNSQSVNSAIYTIFLFPLISYVFNFVLLVMNQNMIGDFLSVAFNVMITLSVLSTSNANSAASISSEGTEFAILKTAPSNTSVICWAKIAVTELVNIVAIIMTVIVLSYTTSISVTNLTLLSVLLLIVSTSHIFWSFQLDIVSPKILLYATQGNEVVNNPNVAKAMIIGFIMSTITGVLVLLLLMDDFVSGWIRILLIAIAFLLIRFYLLRGNVKVYFNDIQM